MLEVGSRVALVVGVVLSIVGVTPLAHAHDGRDTSFWGYVNSEDIFTPQGANDDAFNGVKVFLSSPRHKSSGSKGECRPGRDENVNGRVWNMFAADGHYYGTADLETSPIRNLHGRGYKVLVSKNIRDNGYTANRNRSQAWGSKVHIITHTNGSAAGVCSSSSPSYFLVIWEHDNDARDDRDLAAALKAELGGPAPGGERMWRETGLAELEANRVYGDAYVELGFHTKPAAQKWLKNRSKYNAYRYGFAMDQYLDYPY